LLCVQADAVVGLIRRAHAKSQPTDEPKPKHRVDDDFCCTSTWQFLEDHGWKLAGEHATRPGRKDGVSASFCKAEDGTRLLHIFSTNAQPFEAEGNAVGGSQHGSLHFACAVPPAFTHLYPARSIPTDEHKTRRWHSHSRQPILGW
jgi:hypothetical protein